LKEYKFSNILQNFFSSYKQIAILSMFLRLGLDSVHAR